MHSGPVKRTTGPLCVCFNAIISSFVVPYMPMLKPTVLSLLILSTLLAVQAHASQWYGAIAISRSGDWGVATNYLSVNSAEREALRSCGDVNCTIRVTFRGCGAIAEHNRSLAWGVASTMTLARNEALSALDDQGKILAEVCNRRN